MVKVSYQYTSWVGRFPFKHKHSFRRSGDVLGGKWLQPYPRLDKLNSYNHCGGRRGVHLGMISSS